MQNHKSNNTDVRPGTLYCVHSRFVAMLYADCDSYTKTFEYVNEKEFLVCTSDGAWLHAPSMKLLVFPSVNVAKNMTKM